jgi:high-affinity iron transporter
MSGIAKALALLGALALALAVGASGASAPALPPEGNAQALHLLLAQLPGEYASADRTHDAASAARLRTTATALLVAARGRAVPARALQQLVQLDRTLRTTRIRLQPWPLVATVDGLATRARVVLDEALQPAPVSEQPYGQIDAVLKAVPAELAAGHRSAANLDYLFARALYEQGPGSRIEQFDATLAAEASLYWDGDAGSPGLGALLARGAMAPAVAASASALRDEVTRVEATLGEQTISRVTIVSDAAIIVFREGLEAALIIAAITASFVGARRRLRRPVFLGAAAGLVASGLTWIAAQSIIHQFSDGGLRLQAVTGLLAIAVLLLVTNWFFHRVYWSDWIGRFNRRRKTLERLDRTGFISGQTAGFLLLGLTSVYREGFETVLFLQSLQTSAGTTATLLGTAIGLAATFAVAGVMFALQRKLPYKRMLIITGVLIGLVLAIMVGTTAHNLQGIGWIPATATGFTVPFWWNTWFGIFPTWQGIAAQAAALIFVFGSYALARELQTRRPQRRARQSAEAGATSGVS